MAEVVGWIVIVVWLASVFELIDVQVCVAGHVAGQPDVCARAARRDAAHAAMGNRVDEHE